VGFYAQKTFNGAILCVKTPRRASERLQSVGDWPKDQLSMPRPLCAARFGHRVASRRVTERALNALRDGRCDVICVNLFFNLCSWL
jgi:hypothetical protein